MKDETIGRWVVATTKLAAKGTGLTAKIVGKVVFTAAKMAGSGVYAAGKEGLKSLKGVKNG